MAKLQHHPSEYISPMAGKPRWQIRTQVRDPDPIDHREEVYDSHEGALTRAYVLSRRASYMVNGPNREVLVSMEVYHQPSHSWETVFQAKTKLREGAKPI